MKRRKRILLIGMVSVLWVVGCNMEKGVRDGVNDGLSAAISAMIETPINFVLEQLFVQQ